MKRFLGSLIFLLVVNLNLAQDTSTLHTVRLTDGSVLKGKIVEDTDYYIKIVIATGDTIQVGYKNILQSGYQAQKPKRPKREKIHTNQGIYGALSLGVTHFETTNLEIEGIGGYRINETYQIGLYSHFLNYNTNIGGFFVDPRYLSLGLYGRYNINQSDPRLFASGAVGVGIPTNSVNFGTYIEEYETAIFSRADVGIQFASRTSFSVHIKLGLIYLVNNGYVLSQVTPTDFVEVDYRKRFIKPAISFGVVF